MTASSLVFCDVCCLYTPTGGGIRTYHHAKLRWFERQRSHQYVFVRPGPGPADESPAPNVRIITVSGVPAGRGYRLPANLAAVSMWIRRIGPDILETGDPWFSGPLGLLAKRRGHTRLVSSFFHGDPIGTYVAPWVARGRLRPLRSVAMQRMARIFFRVQRMYDVTVASSSWTAALLHGRGINRVMRSPLGADAAFFTVGRERRPRRDDGPRRRLLYAGRLQHDKGIAVLTAALPRLLRETDVTVTIAGVGPKQEDLARFEGPRVHLTGFVTSRTELAALFANHDVLLAPGPHETFGLSALEGLAAGLAVVGPDEGGTGELLRQLQQPYLFRADDVNDFIATVRDAIHRDDSGEDLEQGLQLAERYGTWEHAISNGVENYCRYLSRCTT